VRRVVERVRIDAPIDVVWRALCDPRAVEAWDGARPVAVPDDYPHAGQHARWRTRVGPLPVVLHDRVQTVDAPHRLAARITYGIVDLDEEYTLAAVDAGDATVLTSTNVVRARIPGCGRYAARTTQRAVRAALDRLAVYLLPGHR
jgi:uncharacterized protein YndB with AHSA1/START domain